LLLKSVLEKGRRLRDLLGDPSWLARRAQWYPPDTSDQST
jgi:hypothetical protein